MTREAPAIEYWTHRLSECPAEFLAEPRIGTHGLIHTAAVVADLLTDLGADPTHPDTLNPFRPQNIKTRGFLRLTLVCCWLLSDNFFKQTKTFAEPVKNLLLEGFGQLTSLVAADAFVTDPDRREELARLCLNKLGLICAGETQTIAADRLKSLNSVERDRVLKEIREKEEHERKLLKAMREKEAREAAAKVSRE